MKQKFTLKKIPARKLTEFSFGLMLSMLAMMLPLITKAQYPVSSYTFTQSSGTYTPITGGTLISATIPDYQAFPSITLTPGFNFCGTVYTNAFVTADGLITLGGTTAANTTNGIANGGGSNILLCPFNADMIGSSASGATPNIRYELVGNEHVFQWNDISRYPSSTDRFSFQARLNTVTGTITYVYSVTSVGTSLSYQPVIGIRTANTAGNWQNRTVGTGPETWATSLAGTATTSTLRFSNSSPAKFPTTGQTYVYTPPPPCNTSTTLPTAGTCSATPGSLCLSGNVTLNFTPATTMPAVTGITYKWQTATAAAGPYTDIAGAVTTVPTYTTTTPITASAYFRCVVLCNGTTTVLTSSATSQVVINNPGTPTGTPGTRCGPGTVSLSATGPAGTTLRWYDAPTGGAPLATGGSFTTPYITATSNFYVSAGTAPSPATATIGAGALTPSFQYVTMFAGGWGGYKHQYLIREAEMIAAGILPGSNITSIAVDNANGTGTYNGFSLRLKSTTSTVLTSTFEAGALPVFGPVNYATSVGVNTFTLTSPYVYTGGSLLIETCWSNGTTSNPYSNVRYDNTTYASTHYAYDDLQTPATICGGPTYNGTPENTRPQFKFGYDGSCQGNRVAVLATVTTPPAVTKTAPAIVCNNAIGQISVASNPMTNYTTYSWTPNTADLYTDAGATAPYTTGSAPTVYFKSNVAGQHTYYLYATNATPAACAFADTVKIWVQPDSVTIQAFPDTLCAPSGSTTLKLVPATNYAPNSIQWQQSTDGITYTDITGATGVTYTTPTITANRYYKALIKSNTTGTNCQAPVKLIVVANPTLLSWADSFNCGPGTVTLTATAGGYGNVRWYTSPTANTPVGSGSPWTTPYLGTTTTYYVESGTGAIQPAPTFIGNGTPATWWGYVPYFGSYYAANKAQWLITAAEMQTAGFSAGLITQIGFDVTTKSGTTNIANLTYSMKSITGSTLGATFHTGLQQVFATTNYDPVANTVNVHTLQNAFYWDGVSSIVLEECSSNPTNQYGYTNVKYNNGPSLYYYTSTVGAAPTNCTAPAGTYSTNTRPNIRLTMLGGCRSARQTVTAYIRPKPVVDLGQDINECVDAGAVKVLDAGVQPNSPQFLWDNGSTSQVRAVSTSGTYIVKVTNQYTCATSDTISARIKNMGTATINTVDIQWSVDGVLQTPVTYNTTPISNVTTAPNNRVTVPLGDVFFPDGNPRSIKAWTYQPNGLADEVPLNDSVTQPITAGLPGVIVHISPRDTTICQGTTITLDAGSFPNNPIYIWSNGNITQTLTTGQPGQYSVKVQNTMGCFDRDTISVSVHPNPLVNSIAIIDNGGNTFTFNAIGAQHIGNWAWDFDDGTAPATGTGLPVLQQVHHFTAAGEYNVKLTLSNDCNEIVTTRLVKIDAPPTGIDNLSELQKELRLYPNPGKGVVTVSSYNGSLKLNEVAVYNLMGQLVYQSAIKSGKHELDVSSMAAGIYNVIIATDKGKVTKKLEVVK